MTSAAFIAMGVAMVAIALCWVLPPLLPRRAAAPGIDAVTANLDVLRSQLAELDADERRSSVPVQELASRRIDIERRTLEEMPPLADRGSSVAPAELRARTAAISIAIAAVIAIAMPALAALLYARLGEPHAQELIDLMRVQSSQPGSAADLERFVTLLSRRLDREPGNAGAWMTLARAQAGAARWAEALPAYRRAVELLPGDVELKVEFAQAIAVGGGVAAIAESAAQLEQALALDPRHRKALAMAGAQAFERKDYAVAVGLWERLRLQLPADAALSRQLDVATVEARARAARSTKRN